MGRHGSERGGCVSGSPVAGAAHHNLGKVFGRGRPGTEPSNWEVFGVGVQNGPAEPRGALPALPAACCSRPAGGVRGT